MSSPIPTLDQVRALEGRVFAMLTPAELETLEFYRRRGRRFGVSVSVMGPVNQPDPLRTTSQAQADEILRQANSLVFVSVGQGAAEAWAERAGADTTECGCAEVSRHSHR